MKYILILFALISIKAGAQNYGDSSITLTVTQGTTYWMGQYIKKQFTWSERNAPAQLQAYIGSGSNPDSVISNVSFKAKYLFWALDGIISQPLQVSYVDYRKIVMNQPATPGYTALVTQINTKRNNVNDPQRFVAQWLYDRYQERVLAFESLYNEQKTEVVEWSRH